jgi:hypothetical protein
VLDVCFENALFCVGEKVEKGNIGFGWKGLGVDMDYVSSLSKDTGTHYHCQDLGMYITDNGDVDAQMWLLL